MEMTPVLCCAVLRFFDKLSIKSHKSEALQGIPMDRNLLIHYNSTNHYEKHDAYFSSKVIQTASISKFYCFNLDIKSSVLDWSVPSLK